MDFGALLALLPVFGIVGVVVWTIRSPSQESASPWAFAATELELSFTAATPTEPARLEGTWNETPVVVEVLERGVRLRVRDGAVPGISVASGPGDAFASQLFPASSVTLTGERDALLASLSLDARALLAPNLPKGATIADGELQWTVLSVRPVPESVRHALDRAVEITTEMRVDQGIPRGICSRVLDADESDQLRVDALQRLTAAHAEHPDTTAACLQLIRQPETLGALRGIALLHLARQGAPIVRRELPAALANAESRPWAIAACVACRHPPGAAAIAAWIPTTTDGPLVRDVVSTWPDPRFEPLLLDLIESVTEPASKVAIVQALGIFATPQAVPRLRVHATTGSPRERKAVDAAIGLIQARLASPTTARPRPRSS